MSTLYDLLGARPDNDAEGLTNAFRKATEASRSCVHACNLDTTKRFRQIVEAYDILRDAERRATYDRLLEFERGQLRSKLSRVASCLLHNVISDAIGVVGLAVVLAGGHTLFAYISKPLVSALELSVREPAEVTSIQPSTRTGSTEPDEPHDKLERATDTPMTMPSGDALAANGGGTLEAPKGGPDSNAAGPNMEVAKTDDADAVDQDQARPGEVQLSSQEMDSSVKKSSLSDFQKSDNKRDIKRSDTGNINTHDAKIAEMKMARKPKFDARRQARNHAHVIQASLENRKTFACSGPQACAGNVTPLFGVGF